MYSVKYSLRLLILFVTAIVLFMGWSQYRRRNILEHCKVLKADGYLFAVPNAWHDSVFQRKPEVGIVTQDGGREFLRYSGDLIKKSETIWTDEPKEIERLKRLGFVKYR